MKRAFYFLTTLCLVMSSITAWGEAINENQARAIAAEFMASKAMPSANLQVVYKAPRLGESTATTHASYYVFNSELKDHGYVIVAGDDRAPAVLAYSDRGNFNSNDVPEAMMELLDGYTAQIAELENGAEKNKQAVLNWILSQPRETSHGISFDFSNSNYFLLGEIIAKESKTSYEDYVSQHIFTPLHMTKSCFVSDENTSIPYTGTEQSAKLLCGGVGYSSLGMITNVSNLLELIDGLMTNSIISEATFKKLFTDYGGGYGYGVYVSGIRATGIGGIDAFSAKMSFTTNNNQIYVALSNDSESNPDKIHTLFRDYLMKFRN